MTSTVKGFVLRGLAAGAAGGLAAALFLRFVTEKQIDRALRFEEAMDIGTRGGPAAELSRSTQHWGGMAAAILLGCVLGVVLAVTVAATRHRIASSTEFGRVAKVATAAFVAIVLIPALKYPANPPAVGDPDTVAERTRSYLSFMAVSILIVFAAWFLWQHLTERGLDGGPRFLAGGGALVAMVALAYAVWPASPDRIDPPDSKAAPALQIAATAPREVLAGMLANARATGDDWIRDPADPKEPLDLSTVDDARQLGGAPAAVSTARLVPHAYTSTVWLFRVQSLAGLALMWAVMAGVLGLLLDRSATDRAAGRFATLTR